MNIRKLIPGDEIALDAFLAQYPETSMILRSNLRAVGLVYDDKRYHGDYFAAFSNEDKMIGVLAHYWNGNIITQAPDIPALESLADYFKMVATRKIGGFLGETTQTETLFRRFNLLDAEFSMNENEYFYALDLADLKIPEGHSGQHVRNIRDEDLPLLSEWRRLYNIECLSRADNDETRQAAIDEVRMMIESGGFYVLEIDASPVAFSGFNASIEGCVLIGGVWTPPEHRNRGYARILLAESLRQVQGQGITKAFLFTKNPAAIKAYEAIGFKECGRYRLTFLKKPVVLGPEI